MFINCNLNGITQYLSTSYRISIYPNIYPSSTENIDKHIKILASVLNWYEYPTFLMVLGWVLLSFVE